VRVDLGDSVAVDDGSSLSRRPLSIMIAPIGSTLIVTRTRLALSVAMSRSA